ncbi:MAG TPA: radical SAM protein [Pyrinomonadaceae bacterium]|nr:radical SAM protein [Pyrinomonadaceae bacterium]
MRKVILVNPANTTVGYSVITPRWLYVIAGATPTELVGDPLIIDEPITPFDPEQVEPGDIVGVGIHTGNCRPGYRVVREAKKRGATVIVGGIHPTIFPDEPLEMGADAVVKGGGDLIWRSIVEDELNGRLQRVYDGGRVPGEQMVKARWDLLDPNKYLMGSIQTVAGCPENCSFCSVWVTEGRTPRLHLNEHIIEEANELHALGFRYIFFADDNFTPATLGRIARERNVPTQKILEQMREDRLRLFDQYDRAAPSSLYAFTQMTAEAVSDDEYLDAMYEKMRVRGALIGVESFTEEGLKNANKTWNPVGQRMVEAIQKIQSHGIFVLASIINGLESDTVATLQTMREFAVASGTAFAQFPIYSVYPGTKDYHEMLRDWKNRDAADYVPRHRVKMMDEKFWLNFDHTEVTVRHPTLSAAEIEREVRTSWRTFYSLSSIIGRTRTGPLRKLSPIGKFVYTVTCLVFYTLYPDGIAADNARKKKLGLMAKLRVRVLISVTRRTHDWFGIRPPRSKVRGKQEMFSSEPHGSTFGAELP